MDGFRVRRVEQALKKADIGTFIQMTILPLLFRRILILPLNASSKLMKIVNTRQALLNEDPLLQW